MTAAYQHPDWDKPVGSDTGPNVPTKARDNLRVLRDGLMTGRVKDWAFERSNGTGSADEPQYWIFKNTGNNIWFRMTNTWTSGKITAQLVEWSDDAGASWATVLAAGSIVYDGSLNITSQSVGSGIYVFTLELIAKVKSIASSIAAHIAGTGTSVHGLGSMSTQSHTNIDADGGTIDGVTIGGAARCPLNATRVNEDHGALAPALNAGVTVDWSKGSTKITNNGTNVITFSNVPGGGLGGHVVDCSNLNSTTFPAAVDWGLGGKPSVAGRAVISLITNDGGAKVFATLMWRAV